MFFRIVANFENSNYNNQSGKLLQLWTQYFGTFFRRKEEKIIFMFYNKEKTL